MRFSGLKILTEGLKGNSGWGAHWRDPEPAQEYDIIIIGGGGHGLSTAYYLAKEHGLKKYSCVGKRPHWWWQHRTEYNDN
jgi:sarcosine oxidase subunit beta